MSVTPVGKAASPFVVDVPASLLKRNTQLSKSARILYSTMRSLADGKTGALRIGQRWLKANAIDAAAEMCRDVRLAAMRELAALGLVTVERERVQCFIGGRRRVVFGACRYFVHRQAVTRKNCKNKPFLLKSISSTVEKIDSLVLSEAPLGACQGVFGSESDSLNRESARNHHHRATADNDFASVPSELPTSEKPNRFDVLQERAKQILTAKGEDATIVDEALNVIDSRSAESRKIPSSEAYYVRAFENLKATDDWNAVFDAVHARRLRREKFMPGFTGKLTPAMEARRRKFNKLHDLVGA